MSKFPSQMQDKFNVRFPDGMRDVIAARAKQNGRSMNSEILERLQASLLDDVSTDEIISAKDARHIVNKAKEELSNIIFKRTFSSINKGIRIGHTLIHVDLGDLDLDGLNEDDFNSVFQLTINQLKKLGYMLPENTFDPSGFLVMIP